MFTLNALPASHGSIQVLSSLAPQVTVRRATKSYSFRCLALFAMSLGVVATAQIPSVTDVTMTPTPGVGHDYIQDNVETVNPSSGSLSIRIGVPLPPSRGVNIPFTFAYDSGSAYFLTQNINSGLSGFQWWHSGTPFSQGGWNYSVPMLSVQDSPFYGSDQQTDGYYSGAAITCHMWTDYVFQDASGQRTDLGISFPENNESGCDSDNFPGQVQPQYDSPSVAGATLPTSATLMVSQVGSTIAATNPVWTSEGTVNAVDVVSADGTVYGFSSMQAPSIGYIGGNHNHWGQVSGISPPASITDHNGNTAYLNTVSAALSYVDTIGRTSLSISSFGANPDTLTISGLSQPYQVNWTSASANFPITMTNLAAFDGNSNCPATNGGGNEPVGSVISSITLPNGQQYGFTYDPTYGLINKITYPTGGYVEYSWGLNLQSEYGKFINYQQVPIINPYNGYPSGQSYPGPAGACSWIYDAPAIQYRYVYIGGQLAEQQDFSYFTQWDTVYPQRWDYKQTTVVTHDLVQGSTFKTVYTYGSVPPDFQPNSESNQAQIPVESSVQYYGANGSLLRTVNKTWQNQRTMTQQTMTIANGQVSETDWTYNLNEMVSEKDDYDFGSSSAHKGALLRKTLFPSYHTFNHAVDSLGTPQNILDKPDEVVVEDGSNAVKAGVSYKYDPVGNILGRSDWLNQTGSSALTTSHTYDSNGNMKTTTDPKNYVTTYSYTDAFVDSCSLPSQSNSYLTTITYPTPSSGVSQVKTFQYHCATGDLATSTDENAKTTSYIYNTPPQGCTTPDGLDRLSEIDYPDGGKTTHCYNDAPPNPTILTTTLMNSSSGQSKASLTKLDGLGQQVQSQLYDSDGGTIYVDTVYDGLGHVNSVSNPYRLSSETTYGLTTNTYDALGRPITAVHPDGSSSAWCYDGVASVTGAANCNAQLGSSSTGTWVDSTDENGNHWQRTSDASGRLKEVVELGSSASPFHLDTVYGYDALNNLLSVNQKGNGTTDSARVRSFSYDSLSRLIAASNPETASVAHPPSLSCTGAKGTSWTTCYQYDPNGNLIYKTDNRGVTTSFAYDALNRLASKSYSDGATPSSCYQYDSAPNGKGRLANAWTLSASSGASCATATQFLTKRSILGYDVMGRILNEQQFTLANKVSGYAPAYTYDLAGNLLTSTSGVAPAPTVSPLWLTNTYDSAGRLQTVTSNVASNWINGAPLPLTLFAPPPTQNTLCTTQTGQYAAFGGLQNASFGIGSASTSASTLNRNYDTRLRTTCENDIGAGTTPSTPGSVVVTISGAEQPR